MSAIAPSIGMDEAAAAWWATERDVITWIEAEADVLDRAEFEEWEQLWEPDGAYWLPQSMSQTSPEDHVSLIYDDRAALTRRIDRLSGRLAYALQPAAQVSRIVGNFRITTADDGLIEGRVALHAAAVRAVVSPSCWAGACCTACVAALTASGWCSSASTSWERTTSSRTSPSSCRS